MRVSPVARLSAAAVGAVTVALAVGACDAVEKKESPRAAAVAQVRQTLRHNACASRIAYVRLTKYAFDEAIKIRNADPVNLATLAAYSVVRMEAPLVKSHDPTLDVTVCSGRFILEVPPGAERGFGGERRLIAEIEYAAQPAADGSGLVYHVRGAEPIIYKLAAFDLRAKAYGPPIAGEQARLAWLPNDDPGPAAGGENQQPSPTKALQAAYATQDPIDASPPATLAAREVPLAGVPMLPLGRKTIGGQAPDGKAAATPAKVARQAVGQPKPTARVGAAKPVEVATATRADRPRELVIAKSSPKRDGVKPVTATVKSTAKPVQQARLIPKAKDRLAKPADKAVKAAAKPVQQAQSEPKAKDKLARRAEKPAKAAAKPVQQARSEPKAKDKLAQRAKKPAKAAAKPELAAKAKPTRSDKSSKASALAAKASEKKPVRQAAAAVNSKAIREAIADRSAKAKQLARRAAEKRSRTTELKVIREAKAAGSKAKPAREAGAVSKPRPSRLGDLQAVLARLEPAEAKRAKQAVRKPSKPAAAETVLAKASGKARAPKPKQIGAQPASQLADAAPTPKPEPALKPKPSVVQQAAAPKAAATPLRSAGRSGCSFSRTPSQYLICSDRRLAALDRRTASLMAAAMSDADGWTRAELSRTRNRFISWRDRCRDEACLESAYTDRMAEIREIMADARY
jgi:hypothetical protein